HTPISLALIAPCWTGSRVMRIGDRSRLRRLVSPITQTARSGSVPKDQHLFPVFSESVGGRVIYRAPAAACNACPSKAACTDSDHAREIERNLGEVGSGMQRFHRLLSVTLLVLACL